MNSLKLECSKFMLKVHLHMKSYVADSGAQIDFCPAADAKYPHHPGKLQSSQEKYSTSYV